MPKSPLIAEVSSAQPASLMAVQGQGRPRISTLMSVRTVLLFMVLAYFLWTLYTNVSDMLLRQGEGMAGSVDRQTSPLQGSLTLKRDGSWLTKLFSDRCQQISTSSSSSSSVCSLLLDTDKSLSQFQFDKVVYIFTDGLPRFALDGLRESMPKDKAFWFSVDVPGIRLSHAIFLSFFTGISSSHFWASRSMSDDNIFDRMIDAGLPIRYFGKEQCLMSLIPPELQNKLAKKDIVDESGERFEAHWKFFEDPHQILDDAASQSHSLFLYSAAYDTKMHKYGYKDAKVTAMVNQYLDRLPLMMEWIDNHPDYLLVMGSDHGVDGPDGLLHGGFMPGNDGFLLIYNPRLSAAGTEEFVIDSPDVASTVMPLLRHVDIPLRSEGVFSLAEAPGLDERLRKLAIWKSLIQLRFNKYLYGKNPSTSIVQEYVDKGLEDYEKLTTRQMLVEAKSIQQSLIRTSPLSWGSFCVHLVVSLISSAVLVLGVHPLIFHFRSAVRWGKSRVRSSSPSSILTGNAGESGSYYSLLEMPPFLVWVFMLFFFSPILNVFLWTQSVDFSWTAVAPFALMAVALNFLEHASGKTVTASPHIRAFASIGYSVLLTFLGSTVLPWPFIQKVVGSRHIVVILSVASTWLFFHALLGAFASIQELKHRLLRISESAMKSSLLLAWSCLIVFKCFPLASGLWVGHFHLCALFIYLCPVLCLLLPVRPSPDSTSQTKSQGGSSVLADTRSGALIISLSLVVFLVNERSPERQLSLLLFHLFFQLCVLPAYSMVIFEPLYGASSSPGHNSPYGTSSSYFSGSSPLLTIPVRRRLRDEMIASLLMISSILFICGELFGAIDINVDPFTGRVGIDTFDTYPFFSAALMGLSKMAPLVLGFMFWYHLCQGASIAAAKASSSAKGGPSPSFVPPPHMAPVLGLLLATATSSMSLHIVVLRYMMPSKVLDVLLASTVFALCGFLYLAIVMFRTAPHWSRWGRVSHSPKTVSPSSSYFGSCDHLDLAGADLPA